MQVSGYTDEERKHIMYTAYRKELERHMNGEQDLYRSREEREIQIEAKGGKANKSNWFRKRTLTHQPASHLCHHCGVHNSVNTDIVL